MRHIKNKGENKMIEIQDVTIRDGMQQKGIHKNLKARCEVMDQIGRISCINSVEVGMCTTQEDLQIIKHLIQYLNPKQEYAILTRLVKKDMELVTNLYSDQLVIKLLVPISTLHIEKKLGWTKEQLLAELEQGMKTMVQAKIKMEICLEDATRAEDSVLFQVLSLCNQYPVRYVTICDTVGCMIPKEFGELITKIEKKNYPFKLSIHCHNDMGLATANTLVGILAGANRVETTFLGIGERAGNAAIEEISYILKKKAYQPHINMSQIYKISHRMEKILGYPISDLKPIIGNNVFIHESGIHQDGIKKHKAMYQYVYPEEVGKNEVETSISELSSSKVLRAKAKAYMEQRQYELEVNKIIDAYRTLAKVFGSITIEEVCDYYDMKGRERKDDK